MSKNSVSNVQTKALSTAPANPAGGVLAGSLWPRVRRILCELWGLDPRSLALFRIGLALLILGDLAIRASDLEAFYTDFGVLPRAVYLEKFSNPWFISIHLANGSAWFQAALFAVAALFALALLAGYRTRLATAASWFLLISLQSRNEAILQGGDVLLRLVMFWAMFLPLGARYSVDSALGLDDDNAMPRANRVLSVAGFGLLAQLVMMYWFSVAFKTGTEWRVEGSALYYALGLEQMTTPLGRLLFQPQLPKLLLFLTFMTLAYKTMVPLLLAFSMGPFRAAAVLLIILLHLGMAVFLNLGPFPWVVTVAVLALLPRWFWDEFTGKFTTPARAGLTLYYDGTCSFCRKTVLLLRGFFLIPETRIFAAQDDPGTHAEMKEHNSWIVVEHTGARHYKFEALAIVFRHSPWLRFIAAPMRWRPAAATGTRCYEWVAGYRPALSAALGFLRPRPVTTRTSLAANLFAAAMLIYVWMWNTATLKDAPMPKPIAFLGPLLRLDQAWNMFSPFPLKDDGWYVIAGKLKDGSALNLLPPHHGGPLSWEKPHDISNMYVNERWRKYLMNLYSADFAPYRIYFGRYICRDWNRNKAADDKTALSAFDIYFMKKTTQPNYQPPVISKDLLWNHDCSDVP